MFVGGGKTKKEKRRGRSSSRNGRTTGSDYQPVFH
jgi:hypothetical protein